MVDQETTLTKDAITVEIITLENPIKMGIKNNMILKNQGLKQIKTSSLKSQLIS